VASRLLLEDGSSLILLEDGTSKLNLEGLAEGGDPAPLPHLGLLLAASSGNTVSPSTGHLTFAGYAPGVEQDQAIAAATGHLTFAGYTPSVVQAQTIAAATGHLTFAGYAPGLEQDQAIAPATGALVFTGYAPTVTQSGAGLEPAPLPHLGMGASPALVIYSPATGHMSFAGHVPGVANQSITVYWDDVGADEGYRVKWGTATGTYTQSADVATDVLTYTITGLTYGQTYYIQVYALVGGVEQDPSDEIRMTAGWGFNPGTGNLSFAGYVPTVSQTTGNITVAPSTGHLTFAGYVPSLEQDRSYAASTGHLSFAGYAPSVSQSVEIAAATGHLTFSGYAPALEQDRSYAAATGHLTFAGYAPSISQTASAGSCGFSSSGFGGGFSICTGTSAGGGVSVGHGKPRRRRHYVEIDGQYFEVLDHQHAVEILTKLREAAEEAAPVAVEQVTPQLEAPPEPPRMRVVKPDYSQEFIQRLQAQVDATNAQIAKVYADAWRAHVAQQQAIAQQMIEQREAEEEDDINALIALGVL